MNEAKQITDDEIYGRLLAEQSVFGIIFGSVLGIIVAGVFLIYISTMVVIPDYFLIAPGFIIGFFIKFIGKPFQPKYFFLTIVVTTILYLALVVYLIGSPIMYALLIPNIICAAAIGKRKLTRKERGVIFRKKFG